MFANGSEFSDLRNAAMYDVTQPFIFDNSCFANIILEEIKSCPKAKIVEFGCGTGLLTMKLLSSIQGVDYYGIDLSLAMLAIFARRLAALPETAHRVTLVAPVDLRLRSALSGLVQGKADVILMSQFFQYISLEPHRDDYVSKEEFLAHCRNITKDGGRIAIIEDVHGETPQEHAELSNAWDQAVLSSYGSNLSVIEAALVDLDPDFLQAIRTMITQPNLLRIIREKRRAARGEEIISLSAWKRLLDRTGLTYRIVPHDSLSNFYLFILER